MKLKCDKPLSNFAFNYSWRRYIEHPTLRFEEAAAVNSAMHRAAAGLVGQPFLAALLQWCESSDVSDAVEAVREAGALHPSTFQLNVSAFCG